MKYFKYPYMNIAKKKSKLRFKNLDKKAQRNARIIKAITFAFTVLYFALLASFISLTTYLSYIIENKVLKTIISIGMVIVTIVAPVAIMFFILLLVDKHLPPLTIGELTLQNIQEITLTLKKYYKISDPKTVTKCYKCSKACFDNKDITIFLHNGKIRITIDFDHSIKDLGCYEFGFEEASFYASQE